MMKTAQARQNRDSEKAYFKEKLSRLYGRMKDNGEFRDYETTLAYAPYHLKKQEKSVQVMRYMCVQNYRRKI